METFIHMVRRSDSYWMKYDITKNLDAIEKLDDFYNFTQPIDNSTDSTNSTQSTDDPKIAGYSIHFTLGFSLIVILMIIKVKRIRRKKLMI